MKGKLVPFGSGNVTTSISQRQIEPAIVTDHHAIGAVQAVS